MADGVYHCKMCNEMFKTTAELQKHKRTIHRSLGSPENELAVFTGSPPVVVKQEHYTNVNSVEDVNVDGGHCHGTRSKTRASNGREDDLPLEIERHATCDSCGEHFDTKDKVILHLLRQSRSDFGTIKCPYCGKNLVITKNGPSPGYTPPEGTTSTANGTEVTGEEKSVLSYVAPSTPQSRPQRKRKLSSPQTTEPAMNKSKRRSSVIRKEKCTESYSTVTPASTSSPASVIKVDHGSGLSPFVEQSSQVQHERVLEVTYRQPRGKGSRGGVGGRRNSGITRTSDDSRSNPSDSPLKVSVLINNNPYPSEKRLAVPKGKHFQKGDIRCPYCGFEAASVREIQFHVNTHMPKSYPCEFCTHIYRSKQAVMKHTERHHADKVKHIKGYKTEISNTSSASASPSSQPKREIVEEDQNSMMSNYSSSMASESNEIENYYSEAGASRDSNYETPVNFQPQPAMPLMNPVGYYVPEVPNQSYFYQPHHPYYNYYYQPPPTDFQYPAYLPQYQNLQREHELFMAGGNVGKVEVVERVIDVNNF